MQDKTLESAVSQMVKVLKISVYQLVNEGFTKATVSSGVNVMGVVNLNVNVHLEEQMAAQFKRREKQEKRKGAKKSRLYEVISDSKLAPTPVPEARPLAISESRIKTKRLIKQESIPGNLTPSIPQESRDKGKEHSTILISSCKRKTAVVKRE